MIRDLKKRKNNQQGAVLIRQLTDITVSSVMPVLVYPSKL